MKRSFGLAIGMFALLQASIAAGSDEVATQGSCFQSALATAVNASDVRPFVPSEFPLVLEPAGKASVFIYTVDCDDYRVDGGPAGDTMITGVAAFVLPRDGSPGVEAYDILMTTDHAAFYSGMTGLGLFQGLVHATMTVAPVAGPVVGISADTPWSHSPYSYEMTAITPPPAGITFPSVHWQLGSRGLVRTDYTHSNFIITPGTGAISAAAGSPLATILGATTAQGAGGILQFSFTGVTKLVEPPPPPTSSPNPRPRVAGDRILADTGVGTQHGGVGLTGAALLLAGFLRARRPV